MLSYVGVAPLAGFEPTASGSGHRRAIRCATGALTIGVTDGARTRNLWDHNPALYHAEVRGFEPPSAVLPRRRLSKPLHYRSATLPDSEFWWSTEDFMTAILRARQALFRMS